MGGVRVGLSGLSTQGGAALALAFTVYHLRGIKPKSKASKLAATIYGLKSLGIEPRGHLVDSLSQ
jgi:hypothetical protein